LIIEDLVGRSFLPFRGARAAMNVGYDLYHVQPDRD
jgi:hypothetical protein